MAQTPPCSRSSSLAQSVGLAFAKVGVNLPLRDLRRMLAVPHLRYAVAVVLLFVEQQRHDACDDGGCDNSADEDGAIGRVHTTIDDANGRSRH